MQRLASSLSGVHPRRRARAFSLIELLVVVGLIALLAGGIGLALGDAGSNSLANAQTTLASMVGTARAQAAVHQTEAIVAIYGVRPPGGDAEKYLRLIQVFRNDAPGAPSPTWVPVGNPVALPRGVYLVPTSTTGLLAQGVVWPTNPPLLSTLTGPVNLGQPAGTPFGGTGMAFTVQFNSDGTVTPIGTQPYARLVVATATTGANNVPQFNNAGAARGLIVRWTSAVTFVSDATGF